MAGPARRGWQILIVCSLGLGAASCSRNFSSASSGTVELGQLCGFATECISQACVDGVCCEAACGATAACNLAGSLGRCVPRPLGTTCADATSCPSGFCQDGVCCDQACTGNCMSCVVPIDGGLGTCSLALDNTDPHHDCGPCAACFAGDCGPAFANTDPHHECDDGETCNGNYNGGTEGLCEPANGYVCDSDGCAGNGSYCIGWRCMETSYFHVDAYPFLATDHHRTPVAIAVGPEGDAAVLVDTDDGPLEDGGYLGSLIAALAPSTLGPWTASSIEYAAVGRRTGAVTFTGDIAIFAVSTNVVANTPEAVTYGASGIYTQAISSGGEPEGYNNVDPDAVDVLQIALNSDSRGQVTLASAAASGELRVMTFGQTSEWGPVSTFEVGATGVAAARANGETQLFYLSSGGPVLMLPDGGNDTPGGLPHDCGGPLAASGAPDDGGDQVGLTFTCGDGGLYLAAYAPTRTDVARWRVMPAPAVGPTYGLGGGPLYPLAQFLPSGGRAGSVIFTALEPGGTPGPTGGFTQTIWLNVDGGINFSYAAGADNLYQYTSMVAGASSTGAPVSAFDSVVEVPMSSETPVTNNSSLLIQVYFP